MDQHLPHTLAPAFEGLFPTPTLDKFTAAARDLERLPVLLDDDALYEFDSETCELLQRHDPMQRPDLAGMVMAAPQGLYFTHHMHFIARGMTLRMRGWKLWRYRTPRWLRSAL